MTKTRAKELSTKLESVLQQFAKDNGLNLTYKGSSFSNEKLAKWSPKFDLFDTTDLNNDSSFEKKQFIKTAKRSFGLVDPEWYGTEVLLSNKLKGTLVEYHPKKRKYPMIIKTDDGTLYKLSINNFKASII